MTKSCVPVRAQCFYIISAVSFQTCSREMQIRPYTCPLLLVDIPLLKRSCIFIIISIFFFHYGTRAPCKKCIIINKWNSNTIQVCLSELCFLREYFPFAIYPLLLQQDNYRDPFPRYLVGFLPAPTMAQHTTSPRHQHRFAFASLFCSCSLSLAFLNYCPLSFPLPSLLLRRYFKRKKEERAFIGMLLI